MNSTVKEIHELLLKQSDGLSDAIANTTDPAIAKQLLAQKQELLHRIDIAQNLQFRQSSKELDGLLPEIKRADDQLKQSLKSAQNAAKLVEQTSKLLQYVDKALDLAKTLAII
jgi:exonuclease VII small subunit